MMSKQPCQGGPVIDITLARAVHVVAVIVWIGGVSMATTAVLPLARSRSKRIEDRFELFEAVERRFVWQARIATLLVAGSGFYMVAELDLWERFLIVRFWWMHAMVFAWLVFTVLLFVVEPFLIHRLVRRRVHAGDETVFVLLQAIHWILLILSLLTAFAAVLGSHGLAFEI
jgi:uncharacterized membrane protein